MNLDNKEFLDGNMSEMWKISDDTVYLKAKKGIIIDFEAQERQLDLLLNWLNAEKLYVIANGENIKYLDRKAREWSTSKRSIQYTAAVALVMPNIFSKLLGSMYLGFNAPPLPIKMFDNVDLAWKWIEGVKFETLQ